MGDWLTQTVTALSWRDVVIGVVVFLITFTVSLALVSFILVKLPATYFHESHDRNFLAERHRMIRWSGMLLKNFVGLLLVLLGIVMSLPGVPGQGILTILIGVMLLDFPGKRKLEHRLVSRPKVLSAINRLRAKFDKPPLVLH